MRRKGGLGVGGVKGKGTRMHVVRLWSGRLVEGRMVVGHWFLPVVVRRGTSSDGEEHSDRERWSRVNTRCMAIIMGDLNQRNNSGRWWLLDGCGKRRARAWESKRRRERGEGG